MVDRKCCSLLCRFSAEEGLQNFRFAMMKHYDDLSRAVTIYIIIQFLHVQHNIFYPKSKPDNVKGNSGISRTRTPKISRFLVPNEHAVKKYIALDQVEKDF